MQCGPYSGFGKFALLLLAMTPAEAPSPLEKAPRLIEQGKAQTGTDMAAARQQLQEAIALLDGADRGFTDENAYVLRWNCGICAWRLDSDVGVKAWSGVIAYLTRNGKDEPANPDQFRYLQNARHFKANELQEKREQGPDAEKQRQRNFAEAIGLREAAVKAWDKFGDKVAAADARACLGQAMVLGGVVAQGLKGLEITAQACKE